MSTSLRQPSSAFTVATPRHDRVGGRVTPPVRPHHRAYGSVHGGSSAPLQIPELSATSGSVVRSGPCSPVPFDARVPAHGDFRPPPSGALVRGCGQAYALQTVEPVTYRCGTRRVCQARSSGSERDTRARPHAVAPMNCVPEDSRRRSTSTGRTHSPRARADGNQTPSSTVAVRAPSPS